MFAPIFRFELNYHSRQFLFYVLSGVFFVLCFLGTTSDNVSIGGNFSNLNINAPFAVISTLSTLSILALFGAVAFCSNGIVRDFDQKTAELFFTTNVSKFDYLYGRFFGALLFSYGIYFAGLLGVLAAEFAPWLDQERIAPTSWAAYWFVTWAIVLPNLFFMSCIFFCLTTVTRSTMLTYVAAIAFLMANLVLGSFTEQDMVETVSRFEPFGLTAIGEQTRYWTVFERNEIVPVMEGTLMFNRVLWMLIGFAFLAGAYYLFPFSVENIRLGRRKSRKSAESAEDEQTPVTVSAVINLPSVTKRFDLSANVAQFLSQTRIEIRNIVRSAPFIILMLLGLVNVVGAAAGSLDQIFGTPVYPTSAMIVQIINGALAFSLLGVLVYYSGEIMLKERTSNFSEIIDSLPYPNWVMIGAKLTGLMAVIVMMLLACAIGGMAVQISSGYYDLDILVYLQGLLMFYQFPLYFMCVVSIFFFVITRSRYLTMFLVVLYAIGLIAIPQTGFEHYLYRMDKPFIPHSIFTGFGHLLTPFLWYTLYWSLWGLLLLVIIHLLWPRGSEFTGKTVRAIAAQRFTGAVRGFAAATVAGIIATGSFIYYNTNVLNTYMSSLDFEAFSAEYEKNFKQYQYLPQPDIVSTYAEVDIFPEEREVLVKGHYDLKNMLEEPISELHITTPAYLTVNRLDVPGSALNRPNERFPHRIYTFEEPLMPGDTLTIEFETAWLTPGFMNNGAADQLTANGTFFNNLDAFPFIGYATGLELQDNSRRRKHGLEPVERMRTIDDEAGRNSTALGGRVRSEFETIVSTSVGQTAIAPGYLQKEWQEGDRAYFHYKMDEPIWSFYSYLSGDYKVRQEMFNDISIEVYYQHEVNVDRMIYATKRSLEYFEGNFTPYQYRQFRIIEFPRYQGVFAQSFPNTIPYSEAIGFTADLRDKKDIDYVFYVTAHELAHQWWAHQVLGGDVQGQTMLVETFAQYFALMVMEEEYGEETMKRFLEFELDRYLRDRGGELIEELPLYLVENQQYIHYRKGSVAMYALKDYIGEDKVNAALNKMLNDFAFTGPPYPTTLDFLRDLREIAGPEHEALITDMLEKIVLFDLKVEDVAVTEQENGQFEITMDVSLAKFEAEGDGQEREVDVTGLFDIALLGARDEDTDLHTVIQMQKYPISQKSETITILSDVKPHSVGIDPFNKLVDRNPDDNIKSVGS